VKLRSERLAVRPLDPIEQILCSGSIIGHRRLGKDPQLDAITEARWLAHGLPVMQHWADREERYRAHPPPWPWLLFGDPAGWVSEVGERWLAVQDALEMCERTAWVENVAFYRDRLRRVLAELHDSDAVPQAGV
jgi:hypothetical protein